jgi:hypothetical protein
MNSKDPVILKIAYYFLLTTFNIYLYLSALSGVYNKENQDPNFIPIISILFTIVVILTFRKLLIINDNNTSDYKQIKEYLKSKMKLD